MQIGKLQDWVRYDQEASHHILDTQYFTLDHNNCYVWLDDTMKVHVYIGDTTKADIDHLTTQHEHGQQDIDILEFQHNNNDKTRGIQNSPGPFTVFSLTMLEILKFGLLSATSANDVECMSDSTVRLFQPSWLRLSSSISQEHCPELTT